MARAFITSETYQPCPCCGYRVFDTAGISLVCPICAWEDADAQLQDPYRVCAPNWISLYEAQLSFLRCGVSQLTRAEWCNTPLPNDLRDKSWRPIRHSDNFGTCARRANLKLEEYSELYYWTDAFWNNKTSYKRHMYMSMS